MILAIMQAEIFTLTLLFYSNSHLHKNKRHVIISYLFAINFNVICPKVVVLKTNIVFIGSVIMCLTSQSPIKQPSGDQYKL
jgi:hypothetical protein